jgi:hypothetical protein|nr:MAG TPA: hypothetical protein [Caudoviricetes sp.]DAY14082.1 MAG TPA: hypothetical protein [Caudoviricetes sp.]
MSNAEKTEKELMLKALELLQQLQGLRLREAHQVLELMKIQLNDLQSININDDILQQRVEEWQSVVD